MQLPHHESRALRSPSRRLARASWLALAVFAAASGCSEDKKTGGLTVVVESDLSMPKDIDRVRFEVSQEGRTLRTEDHLLGEGQLLMPAEFQIKPVGNANPVLIRALGFKGGIARIERSVITTVPSNFVAMMRLPLTYLCAGTAREDGTSTCGEAQTCKLGLCQSAVVDAATLPVYQSGPWTGSEGGKRDPTANDCFDVLNCFSQAYRVDLNRDTCTFVIDNDDPANISVGIKLPQGSDGICGAGSCWIALDAGAEGWTVEGTIFKLPDALCRDQSDGSRLVIVASNMCGGKTLNTPTCGTWSAATHPIDTSESIGTGTHEDGVEETPGAPVGLSCAGLSYQPCGDCGQQRRTCMNGTWSEWGECLGQGVCSPNQSEMCGSDGMRVCMNTCDWDDCAGQTCAGNAVEACGNCGTRRRTCNNGEWSAWGECENSGQCAPGATQPCGSGGTQACMGNCQWGACGTEVCLGAPSQACGNCGTQTRTCNAETMQWSEFGICGQEGECEANQTRTCGLRGMQACGGNCQWDAACTGQVCEGPASQQCGNCGIQTRTCDSNTGQWSAWSECMSEGVCTPGAAIGCGVGGTRVCLSSCFWSEECSGQICAGPMTESCGNCGTRSRECDGTTATWKPWGPCTNTGPCNPGATRRCGSGGTQSCTNSCQWSRQCLGQSCAGEATEPCGDCGTRSRSCNGGTGQYGDWGQCLNQGPCTPGDIVGCGALKERVCQDSCRYDTCHCVAGATLCGDDACVNLQTDPQHCGQCGKSCNGLACKNGQCETCPSGQHNCGGECRANVDVMFCGSRSEQDCDECELPDNAPTGSITTCNGNPNTNGEACGVTCPKGTNPCGSECVRENDPKNCGACGNACMPGEDCSGGKCTCGGEMCTNAPPHSVPTCNEGMCDFTCTQGYYECSNNNVDKCASDTDRTSCGKTCDVCEGAEQCVDGVCTVSCGPGTHQCGTSCASDTDPNKCGQNCVTCDSPKTGNGVATCNATSGCGIDCNSGYHECRDGTCASDSDENRCTASCTPCAKPGATGACVDNECVYTCLPDTCGSNCTVCPPPDHGKVACTSTGACGFTCDEGYNKCGDRCVANDDESACGSSCMPCDTKNGEQCIAGRCELVCTGETHECNNACVENDSINHCGSSCDPCKPPSNATATCDGKTCGFTCSGSYFECEDRADGCGSDSDPQACGAKCETCGANQECANGTCQAIVPECDEDQHLCDGKCVADDSLEHCGTCGNACRNGETCSRGSCGCANGTLNDVNNCGTCGNDCPGVKPACNGGKCACAAGTCGPQCEVCDDETETCTGNACVPKPMPPAGQNGGGDGPGGEGGMSSGGTGGNGGTGDDSGGQSSGEAGENDDNGSAASENQGSAAKPDGAANDT